MIEMRRAQRSFGDGLIAEEVSDLREDWMKHADAVLADDEIVAAVYEALGKRRPQSRCRGRRGAPADMVLRLLVLKHIRNWSYEVLEREVRANLVYRDFTHVGGAKTPDAKTMGRWGVALGPEVLKQVHEGVVRIARDKGVIAGRRMRVDTTVVETDIHHPTDSTLLGDGVRVLTRIMRKITNIAGAAGTKLRNRNRSVKLRLLEIGRVARAKGPVNQDKLKRRYRQLLDATSRVVGQAKRFSEEIVGGVKRSTNALTQPALEGLHQELDEMTARVKQVMKQTRARIFRGNTRSEGKLLSLFEPSTEVIRLGPGRVIDDQRGLPHLRCGRWDAPAIDKNALDLWPLAQARHDVLCRMFGIGKLRSWRQLDRQKRTRRILRWQEPLGQQANTPDRPGK